VRTSPGAPKGLVILNRGFHIEDWGVVPYGEALERQERAHDKVVAGDDPYLIFCQHPPTVTLGQHADRSFLRLTEDGFKSQGIQLISTDRGGEATAHEPGQIVCYPIVPVQRLKLSVKTYVYTLEQSVIDCLAEFGIVASRHQDFPGVWVEQEKICALGIRIKNRVSMHGLALNVVNTLETFRSIVPCGISQFGITSVARYTAMREHKSNAIGLDVVQKSLVDKILQNLSVSMIE
jgi:lipoyl(octanoyl) transferase